jgi:peptidoglycan hydrolase CwlO-like protein
LKLYKKFITFSIIISILFGSVAYAGRIAVLHNQYTSKMREYIELCKEKIKIDQQIALTKAQISDLRARIAALEKQLRRAREETEGSPGEDLAFDLDELRRQLRELQERLANLQTRQQELDRKIGQLQKELQDIINELREKEGHDARMWGWLDVLTRLADLSGGTSVPATPAAGQAESIKDNQIRDPHPTGPRAPSVWGVE